MKQVEPRRQVLAAALRRMGRQQDKRRHSETPAGLRQQEEELSALIADAHSYNAAEDDLAEESAAEEASASQLQDPMWLDGCSMRIAWPQPRTGRLRDRLGVIYYRPLQPRRRACNVYAIITERAKGRGWRERRTCWAKLAARSYTILSTTRTEPVPWSVAVVTAIRSRREAGESARSVAISLMRTEGAVRSRLKKDEARSSEAPSRSNLSVQKGEGSDGEGEASSHRGTGAEEATFGTDQGAGPGKGKGKGRSKGSKGSKGKGSKGSKGKGSGGKGFGKGSGKGKGKGGKAKGKGRLG